MLNVKEWLGARNNRQFVPSVVLGGNVLFAKRISDGERFFIGNLVKFNESGIMYTIREFDKDQIYVKCRFHDESPSDSPSFAFPINDLTKIEN